MAEKTTNHHVIVGFGIAGCEAAATLRKRDPESRITLVTMASLLFYNRYDLPLVFKGKHDWKDFLVFPPSYYVENRIHVRRNSRVSGVDPKKKKIFLTHKEEMSYDTLLVASGGRSYIPEDLVEFSHLMHFFATFEEAMRARAALPEGGRALILGGDMIGLDVARNLAASGFKVTLVATDQAFWPHSVAAADRPALFQVLRGMGLEVIDGAAVSGISRVEEGAKGMPARRVMFRDGSDARADVILPFFGQVPSVEFMLGSGVDIERGLLVSPELKTTDERIFAAGDVCQIWSQKANRYRFFHGWKNIRSMGDIAARNMTGDHTQFVSEDDDERPLLVDGKIRSPFWEYPADTRGVDARGVVRSQS